MKRSSGIILGISAVAALLTLAGCGKGETAVELPAVTEESPTSESVSDTEAQTDVVEWEDLEPGRETLDETTADSMQITLPMTSSLCKDAFLECGLPEVEPYRKLVKSDLYLDGFDEGISMVQFGLIYLDADDVPELVIIDRDNHVTPVKIYSLGSDGIPCKMFMCYSEWGKFSYYEKTGIISFSDGAQGYSITHTVKVDRDQIEYLGSAISNSGGATLESGKEEYRVDVRIADKYIEEIKNDRNAYFSTNVELSDEGRLVDEKEYHEYLSEYIQDAEIWQIEYDTGSRPEREHFLTNCLKKEDFLAFHENGVELYRDLVESDEALDGFITENTEMHYGLFLFDDDDIPELAIVDGDYHVAAFKVYSIGEDGKPYEMIMCNGEFGCLYYNCRRGVLKLVYGNQGCFTSFFVKVGKEGITFLGAAFENGGSFTTTPGELDYYIDLEASEELVHEIENNKRFFTGNGELSRRDIGDGMLVSKEEYEAYCRDKIGWSYDVIGYGR